MPWALKKNETFLEIYLNLFNPPLLKGVALSNGN